MVRPIPMLAGALALAAVPLLAACGGSTAPSTAPAASSSAVAAPTPASSPAATPDATPAGDPTQQADAVAAATEKFAGVVFLIGYPDKSIDPYFARLEPLTTAHGIAEVKEVYQDRAKTDAVLARFYAAKQRVNQKRLSPVDVGDLGGGRATATYKFQLVTQQQKGGAWKTVKTGEKDTATVRLVQQDGAWLVDSTQ